MVTGCALDVATDGDPRPGVVIIREGPLFLFYLDVLRGNDV